MTPPASPQRPALAFRSSRSLPADPAPPQDQASALSPEGAQALRDENERLQRVAGRYYVLYEDAKQQHNDEVDRWRDHVYSYSTQLEEMKEKLRKLEEATGVKVADLEKGEDGKERVEG